tara:strand:+ start:231 stop:656 length:426 start_codon:yes stop_codon:yes gene_type:complete
MSFNQQLGITHNPIIAKRVSMQNVWWIGKRPNGDTMTISSRYGQNPKTGIQPRSGQDSWWVETLDRNGKKLPSGDWRNRKPKVDGHTGTHPNPFRGNWNQPKLAVYLGFTGKLTSIGRKGMRLAEQTMRNPRYQQGGEFNY